MATINPSTISEPRTAEDLLIAHLVYKCVVKLACWVWPRIKTPDCAKLEPWVSYMGSMTGQI